MGQVFVILGNQLFPGELLPKDRDISFFMAEDLRLCTYVSHHQQKLVLILAAMRAYRDDLTAAGYSVDYRELDDGGDGFEEMLEAACTARGARVLAHFEVEGRSMERRLRMFAERRGLEHRVLPSPMFLCPRADFSDYVSQVKRPLMAEFYRRERRRLGLLMTPDGRPQGGKWSFDAENRKKLPENVIPPPVAPAEATPRVREVQRLVAQRFGHHPGRAEQAWLPTTRAQALTWLESFLQARLEHFGDYEDALSRRSPTVFHSVLSPLLNIGLITPAEVVERTVAVAADGNVPLNSLEGFLRQIIGWREFIRGIYQNFGERQKRENFWGHHRSLTGHWYSGETGIPPLDDTIRTAERLGWTHHIPRLMVVGNIMTLSEIAPQEAHRWFMEMYADSANWVMGPNVFGMALFSDGGIFATKPYVCGSNYLVKMSDYGRGEWCDAVDGLYWRFVGKHLEFFASNPRLAVMSRAYGRLRPERKERIMPAAEAFLERYTG